MSGDCSAERTAIAQGDESHESNESKPTNGSTDWLGATIGMISILGVVLCLCGYGVALSAENRLGVPHGPLISSTLDLIDLSAWAVMNALTGLSEALTHWERYISHFLWLSLVLMAGTLMMWTAIVLLGSRFARYSKQKKQASQENKSSKRTVRELLWMGPLLSVAVGVGGPLAALFSLLAVMMLSVTLSLLPVLSMAAGEAHIRDDVVAPSACFPLKTRDERMAPPEKTGKSSSGIAAMCVAVKDGKDVIAQGRVVYATSTSIVLYDPATGGASRIPIDDKVLEVVPNL